MGEWLRTFKTMGEGNPKNSEYVWLQMQKNVSAEDSSSSLPGMTMGEDLSVRPTLLHAVPPFQKSAPPHPIWFGIFYFTFVRIKEDSTNTFGFQLYDRESLEAT